MYDQKLTTFLLILFSIASSSLFAQAHVKTETLQKEELEAFKAYESPFEVGYAALKKDDPKQAKKIFKDVLKKDIYAFNYDVYPFLAESHRQLGELDSAKSVYDKAITLVDDLNFFHPKVKKYKLILNKLTDWYEHFPEFPAELLEENGFVPFFEFPMPQSRSSIEKYLKYPKKLRKSGFEGKVILKVLISESGKAKKFEVERSLTAEADSAAINAVKQTQFTVPKVRGRISELWVRIPIVFRLK